MLFPRIILLRKYPGHSPRYPLNPVFSNGMVLTVLSASQSAVSRRMSYIVTASL